jgi:glycosyltransferase involved in cell wall biosynthesis
VKAGTPEAPRLTIVIPTVNRESLVSRAIDSAIAQTFPSIEIIVSNNGSTDGTRALLDRYNDVPRLRIVHLERTIPATEHGNFLIEQSRGEFFLGLSDDDWLEPNFAAKVFDLLDRHPDLSFVWTGCFMHYAGIAVPAKIGPEVESGIEFLAALLAGERNVCWCACVTRTADLRKIGPIPRDVICGDMFFWTKLAKSGNVGCVADPISHYLCYRDDGDGSAGGSTVIAWSADTARWVSDIVKMCETTPGSANTVDLKRNAARFLFRSTANQFVWQRMRGVSRSSLLRSVKETFPLLRGPDPSPWMRVVASLVAPRWLLRQRMLAEAARKAKAALSR